MGDGDDLRPGQVSEMPIHVYSCLGWRLGPGTAVRPGPHAVLPHGIGFVLGSNNVANALC